MKPKLREDDRRALDLLLDRGPSAAGKSGPSFAVADTGMRDRIPKIQKVLLLLDSMAAAEPPHDLVARTLEYVQAAATSERNVRPVRNVISALADQPPIA